MKILFIANIRFPNQKVHAIQVAHMCEAFAKEGAEVTLLVPELTTPASEVYDYYGVDPIFKVRQLHCIGSPRWGKFGFKLRTLTFGVSAFIFVLFSKSNVVFSRDEFPLLLVTHLHVKTIWEIHNEKLNRWGRKVLWRADKVVAISSGLKQLCIEGGARPEKILLIPNGVDPDRFKAIEQLSKIDCRFSLDLPPDRKLAIYAGHLLAWKGAGVLAEASNFLNRDTCVIFVGRGDDDFINNMHKSGKEEQMIFVGKQPYEKIPMYLKAADVLVLPTSAKEERARLYTSPIKLFEYMLASRPIVATDLPSTSDILDDKSAYLVRPDDAEDLATGIVQALTETTLSKERAEQAKEVVKSHSWQARAKNILEDT